MNDLCNLAFPSTYARLSQLVSRPSHALACKFPTPIVLVHGPSGIGKSFLIQSVIDQPFQLDPALISAYFQSFPNRGVQFYFYQFNRVRSSTPDRPAALILDNIESFFSDELIGLELILQLRQLVHTENVLIIATTTDLNLVPPQFTNLVTDILEIPVPTQPTRTALLNLAAHLHAFNDPISLAEPWGRGFVFADIYRLVDLFKTAGRTDLVNTFIPSSCLLTHSSTHADSHDSDQFILTKPDNVPDFRVVAGYVHVKNQLKRSIINPYKYPKSLHSLGFVHVPTGIVLHGPPGTGKSQLARCVAGECNVALITVNVSNLVRGLVGESEKQISRLFAYAKSVAPCILVLDELDAVFRRTGATDDDLNSKMSVQFIMEMDSLYTETNVIGSSSDHRPVIVIATTNYLDMLSRPILRSGRFDTHIHTGLPKRQDRQAILQSASLAFDVSLDFDALAKQTKGSSCTDLLALVNQARLDKARTLKV